MTAKKRRKPLMHSLLAIQGSGRLGLPLLCRTSYSVVTFESIVDGLAFRIVRNNSCSYLISEDDALKVLDFLLRPYTDRAGTSGDM